MKALPTIRTRFAPSPTGKMHLGGIKTALVNYLFAKKHGGEFLLRIEDTDEKRFDPDAEKYIIDTLKWMDIIPDHGPTFGDGRFGPYRQSERSYRPFVDKLLKSGDAYYAFDTAEELEDARKATEGKTPFSYNSVTRKRMRNSLSLSADATKDLLDSGAPYTIRFKMPDEPADVAFTDLVRGTVVFNTAHLDDKVIFKASGIPTYHLAVVVDDYFMKITHALRGEEWLSSTPLHLLLYDALEWKAPEFGHLPLLLDKDGKKLSKRRAYKAGTPIFPFTTFVVDDDGSDLGMSEGLCELGYDPKALFNYLALLGWNPKDNREIMSREELIAAFDIAGVNSAGAMFDVSKASHFNKVYLTERGGKELVKFLPENVFNYPEANLEKIALAGLGRVSFAKDISSIVGYLFADVELPVADMKKLDEFSPLLDGIIRMVEIDPWDPEAFNLNIAFLIAGLNADRNVMMNNLRLCFTGGASGPKIHEMMDMMGRSETLRRLNKAKERLASLRTEA